MTRERIVSDADKARAEKLLARAEKIKARNQSRDDGTCSAVQSLPLTKTRVKRLDADLSRSVRFCEALKMESEADRILGLPDRHAHKDIPFEEKIARMKKEADDLNVKAGLIEFANPGMWEPQFFDETYAMRSRAMRIFAQILSERKSAPPLRVTENITSFYERLKNDAISHMSGPFKNDELARAKMKAAIQILSGDYVCRHLAVMPRFKDAPSPDFVERETKLCADFEKSFVNASFYAERHDEPETNSKENSNDFIDYEVILNEVEPNKGRAYFRLGFRYAFHGFSIPEKGDNYVIDEYRKGHDAAMMTMSDRGITPPESVDV